MADVNPDIPAINELNSTADPKIRTALQTLVSTINALETANLADGAVTLAKLAADAAPQVYRGGTGGNTSVPNTGVMTTLEIGESETPTSGLSTSSGDVATAAGGLYLVTATVDFQSTSTETYRGVTLVGSTAGVFASIAAPGAYGNSRVTASAIVRLAAAETVTVKAAHNAGASRNVNVHNFGMTRLSA